MEPAADPAHPGNSPKYHSGKPCRVYGCTNPAGTWWGPSWCQQHNADRLARIGANLADAVKRVELRAAVEKETADLRAALYAAYAENWALVFAAGGTITVKPEHRREPKNESRSRNPDGSETYRYS